MNTNIDLYEILKEKGYKFTSQRKIIFDEIIKHYNEHLTIDQLYNYIKATHPTIGLTTVYRSIEIFCKVNLVEKINLDNGVVHYELINDIDNHTHHHLICSKCRKIIEVKEDLMDSIEKIFEENYGFLVSNHQTKFFGACQECRSLTSI